MLHSGVSILSVTLSPLNYNDVIEAIKTEQPKLGNDDTAELEDKERDEGVFGAHLCNEVNYVNKLYIQCRQEELM